MRKHLDTRPLLFAAGKVSVVIHLRRSDLERGDTRATPDEYYYRLAKEIGQILPAELLDFHVWSSTKNIPAYDYHYWTSKDYDGYRERGMTVHLDEQIDNNDDMIKAWTHMARADIFIMSQSSFSMVPAYMNTNCVIYPSNIDAPLENWINGRNEARESYKQELEACVGRAQKHAGVAATTGSAGVENEKVPQVREKTEMESKTCNLKVCNLHEAQVPRLKSILEAIAIAWRNTLNFGGVVGQLQPLTDQHINFRVIVDALFGPDASRDFFLYNISSRSNFAMEFENVRKLEAGAKQLPAGALRPLREASSMCSFLVANWLISNLAYSNFFLQPRGPDETTRWQGYGFDFVHNLLHMTGEKVLQPFHDPDRRLVALFNGEIYNWEELGSELGSSFRSDGEVILSEYQRHGGSFVRRLDGEFALALFDFQRRELILARERSDPFGTKPLWFASSAALGRFACASYRSALERLGFEEQDIHQVEPNTALHLRLPSTEAGEAEAPVATGEREGGAGGVEAIQKRAGSTRFAPGRAVPAMCLSDGYDSGSIAVALGELGIAPAMYTVQAREDVRVLLARLEAMRVRHMNASWKLTQLSQEEFQREKTFLRENAEKVFYKLRPGYANVDDKAAAGLSWIYRQAAHFGQRLFLSGSGADEVISDYGAYGAPLATWVEPTRFTGSRVRTVVRTGDAGTESLKLQQYLLLWQTRILPLKEVEKVMKDAATCCSSLRSIELESLRPGGENFRVTMMGRLDGVNDAESTADGLLPQTAHIVHLKGTWWRNVLPEGRREITTPTRSFAWNWQAFELWHHHYVHFLRLLRDGGFEVY
eukprot:g24673.t1